MTGDWLRQDRAELAVDRLLDAAERAYGRTGVAATSMAEIAREAGCSRATLYAYFPNRHDLRVSVMNRAAVRMAAEVGAELSHIDDPRHRLVEAVLGSVERVRATPSLAAWFVPADISYATELSRSSEVLDAIAGDFTASVGPEDGYERRLRARWIVRSIVSLLVMPGEDEREERAMVERFLVPSVMSPEARRQR